MTLKQITQKCPDWFNKSNMDFFNTRVCSKVLQDSNYAYFVTSEQFDDDSPRLFSVRRFDKKTSRISTIGEFQGYAYSDDAYRAIGYLL